jgi:hypothetical protein
MATRSNRVTFPLAPSRVKLLERLDSYVFRCWGCGAWRLPEQYMNKPHKCIDDYLQEQAA